jgi:hypothetical protein
LKQNDKHLLYIIHKELSCELVDLRNTNNLFLYFGIAIAALLAISSISIGIAQAQQNTTATTTTTTNTAQTQSTNVPKASVLEGRYLSIERPRFREGGTSGDSITGTIINNSNQEVSSVTAYAILFDKDNKVISIGHATADISTLKPGDDSAFKIDFFDFSNNTENPDHFTVLPVGQTK